MLPVGSALLLLLLSAGEDSREDMEPRVEEEEHCVDEIEVRCCWIALLLLLLVGFWLLSEFLFEDELEIEVALEELMVCAEWPPADWWRMVPRSRSSQ